MKRKIDNKLRLAPFEACDYLDNEETIAEYLSAALENPDPNAFIVAIQDVVKAKKISKPKNCSFFEQQQFDRTFKGEAPLSFNTVRELINSIGIRFKVVTQSTC